MRALLVALPICALIGLGSGWLAGARLLAAPEPDPGPAPVEEVVAYETAEGASAVLALPPLLTNLRAPAGTWVRVELALVFAQAPIAAMGDAVHADALAYLRSLSLPEIASPSGFAFLKADLAERARDLSGGEVTGVLVRSFLIE